MSTVRPLPTIAGAHFIDRRSNNFWLSGTGKVATQVGQQTSGGRATRVVVATSVMLSFISFWRAAAIVLNDLGSSAYYVGGDAGETGRGGGPLFIPRGVLFLFSVGRPLFESCAV